MLTYKKLVERLQLENTHGGNITEKEIRDLFVLQGDILEVNVLGDFSNGDGIRIAMDEIESIYHSYLPRTKGLVMVVELGSEVNPLEIIAKRGELLPSLNKSTNPIIVIRFSEEASLGMKVKVNCILFGVEHKDSLIK